MVKHSRFYHITLPIDCKFKTSDVTLFYGKANQLYCEFTFTYENLYLLYLQLQSHFIFFITNLQVLLDRRSKSEDNESDPLVWTNERVIKWVQSIDLEVIND